MTVVQITGIAPRAKACGAHWGLLLAWLACGQACADEAMGPLRVHPANGRYFADGAGKAVYLTGSHTWGNLCDGTRYPPFDFAAYLDFLEKHNHNFIRLWSGYSLEQTPCPYERTGPGQAADGKPKVDLNRLNPAYFERLRDRVIAARKRGIYVGIMLFAADGAKREDRTINLFLPANNIQGLNGDANADEHSAETYDLSVPRITAYQEVYVRKVIDTVNDFDNVLYEIGNEGDLSSVKWQFHFIDFIKKHQASKPKQHPVGMTAVFDIVGGTWATRNDDLLKSEADWISPGLDPYKDDPPAADGHKVIIADVDHIWPPAPQRLWFWKCFTRGLNPILMDSYTYGEPSQWSKQEQEIMRAYMGQTLLLSRKINLAAMTPQGKLCSSGYCLADPGKEYVAYLPAGGKVTLDLAAAAGELRTQWLSPATGKWIAGDRVSGGAKRELTAPFDGDAVLHVAR